MYVFAAVAGLAALYFVVTAVRRPGAAVILAALLWAAYAVYEYYVANGTLCDANCNIRVDLVLFIPLLAFASFLGLQTQPRRGVVTVFYVLLLAAAALLAWAMGVRG